MPATKELHKIARKFKESLFKSKILEIVEIKNPYVSHMQNHYEDIANKCGLHYIKFQEVEKVNSDTFPSIQISEEDCVIKKETYLSRLKQVINQNSSACQTNASASV